ncbi:MAG: hypothetical protein AWU57_195 [Marinobacter sp. T13-3]|nr:MAG: hypothetical protein AWU57_195 [Marinobacter sp. T13-3]
MRLPWIMVLTLIALMTGAQAHASGFALGWGSGMAMGSGMDDAPAPQTPTHTLAIVNQLPDSQPLCEIFAYAADKANAYRLPGRTPAFGYADILPLTLDLAIALTKSTGNTGEDATRAVRAASLLGLMSATPALRIADAGSSREYVEKARRLCERQPGVARDIVRTGLRGLNSSSNYELRHR